MLNLSKPDTTKGPGRTVVMILFVTLVIASVVVVFIPWDVIGTVIDKWTSNVKNQVIIFCGLVTMLFLVVLFCKIKKW